MTANARVSRTEPPPDAAVWLTGWHLAAVLAAHVGIGLVLRSSSIASTVYTGVTVFGACVVVVRTRDAEHVAAAVAYIAGAEVLWRMTRTHAFWETGKYASTALLLVAAIRFFPGWRRAIVPGVYLAMFVPGIVLAARHFGISSAREPISFNLSGPLALAVAVWFFSQVCTTLERFRAVLWAVVPPITAIATITLTNTIVARSITFNGESNFTTSGGFGPNQVSAALSFGVLVCLLLVATETQVHLRLLEIGLSVWFLGQAVLTFARGGVANVIVAVVLALVVMAGRARRIGRFALVTVVAVVLAGSVLLPRLDDYTGGHLFARYQDQTLTERGSIVADDLNVFRDHPFVGVGLGVAETTRPANITGEAAHTEFTRLLAEQGVFGAVAAVAMVVMVFGAFRRAQRGVPRAFVAAMVGWSFTEMTHSATRIVITSFSIALAVAAAGMVVTEREPAVDPAASP